MHFIEKIVDFDINGVVSGIFNSNFAEIWSGDRFRDYPKNATTFEILFFCDFKSKIVSKSAIFRLWPPEKLRKIKVSEIVASLFCITPKCISRQNFSIIWPADSRNKSTLCQNWPFFPFVCFPLYLTIPPSCKWS